MNKFFLILLLFVIPFQSVYAQDILFSIEQSEYYFTINENAVISVTIDNSYDKQISGILQYTVTQQINQGNTQFSTSNSNANSFTANEGNQQISLNLGTSNIPSTLIMNLSFNYDEEGDKKVPLGPLTIHFVSDESQKNNQPNPMQSSSQDNAQLQQSDPFAQQRQQMQQRLDNLLGNQQIMPQDPQQRLQNNQLSQDSTALKQQIQNQLQQQGQTQREFEKQLSSNSDFMNNHNQLLQSGYNVTGGSLDPISNNTGSFEIQYQNSDGKWASLKGQLNNGTLAELQKQTQEQQEHLLEKLKQNSQFQAFHKKLVDNEFSQNKIEFQNNVDKTNIIVQYENQEKDNASIVAVFENDEIQSVTLEENNSNVPDLILILSFIAIFIGTIIAYLFFKKFSKKKNVISNKVSPISLSKPFDYISESKKLILKSQQYYDNEEHKEAFATAGQAIRLFLSYEMGLKKEITNEELIHHVENSIYPAESIRKYLNISSLVEFAKSQATKDEYDKLISLFTKLLDTSKSSQNNG